MTADRSRASSGLAAWIRDVPDYPRPGIVFRDITPLLADGAAFARAVDALLAPFADGHVDAVAGIESRGFIFASAMARSLGAGFVPLRKPGRLPCATRRRDYELEYGSDALEVHADALAAGERVLLVDDLVATGGTLAAAIELVRTTGAELVGASVLVELGFLEPRRRLPADLGCHSVIRYD